MTFAGLLGSNALAGDESKDEHYGEELQPSVGDLIQWTSQGVDQLPVPRRVRGFSDDEEWLFVEDSETGIPVAEVTVVEATTVQDDPKTPLRGTPPIAPLAGGDSLSLSVPFKGKKLTVQVNTQEKKLRREHIEKVRKYLELAADDLEAEESDE